MARDDRAGEVADHEDDRMAGHLQRVVHEHTRLAAELGAEHRTKLRCPHSSGPHNGAGWDQLSARKADGVLRDLGDLGIQHHLDALLLQRSPRRLAQDRVERSQQRAGGLEQDDADLAEVVQRKEVEDALRDRERLIRAILDNSPALIFLKDKEGRYLLVNKEFERALNVSQEEISGKKDKQVFPPEQAAVFQANDLRVIQTGVAMEFEEVTLLDDGPHASIFHKFPLLDPAGKVYAIGGTAIDITERKRAEMESLALKDELATELVAMTRLHEFSTRLLSKAELRPLLEEVLNATIALQNADFGNVQLYNPETKTLEIVAHRGFQRSFLDYFSSVNETGAACGRAMQRRDRVIIEDVLADPDFAPHRQIAASAGFRAVQSTPLFSRSGEPLGMISTHFRQPHRPSGHDLRFTDLYARLAAELIERQRAEATLGASEERFRRYFELGLIGMAMTSPAKGILEVNDELCGMLGYERSELLKKTWAEMTHQDDLAADVAQFDRVMAGEIDGYTFDKRWIRRFGGLLRGIGSGHHRAQTFGAGTASGASPACSHGACDHDGGTHQLDCSRSESAACGSGNKRRCLSALAWQ